MAILGSIRQNTELESLQPQNAVQPVSMEQNPPSAPNKVIGPSIVQNSSTSVSEADYYGITNSKPITNEKRKGFFKSFVEGVDRKNGEQSTGAGTAGDIIGSIVRVPTQKVVEAAVELTPTRKAQRAEIEKIRMTDPNTAKMIEENSIGSKKSGAKLAVQAGAGLAELALTLIPVGLLGKAGRAAFSAAEIAGLSKLGRVGKYIASGAEASASTLAKASFTGATGAGYGSLYGFLSGLEDGGNLGEAFKNIPTYGIGGGILGGSLPFAMRGAGKFFSGVKSGADVAGGLVSKGIPDFVKPTTYIDKLPDALQRVIYTEGSYLNRRFGNVGKEFTSKFKDAYRKSLSDLGNFQDEAAKLGMIDAPQLSKGAYKEYEPLRQRWQNREFRFDVRDALTHEGKFSDPAVRSELLAKDKHLNDIVEFFDKYRKDRGLRAQQSGITDNLLDIDKYFSRYTPQVPLSNKTETLLKGAQDDISREMIYKNNSSAVDDMIEFGVRQGQWKNKLEGYKNYYDAMDVALNIGKVPDNENAYLKWLVENKHADTINNAKNMYIEALDLPRKTLTHRASSLDYSRKIPMPWTDPDPMRVMSYYIRKADERLAFAEQFGVNDEVIQNMKDVVSKSNMGQSAVRNFDKAIRSLTGQVERLPKEERFSSLVRGIESMHLAFSQILNPTTLLNYAITSDFGHLGYGLKKAFEVEGMREAVKRGIFVSDMLRQTTPYSNLGDNMIDKILHYSGFSYTEMMNRAAGIGVSESWAKTNLNKLLASKGLQITPEQEASVAKMLSDKNKAEQMILKRGYENTGKYAKEFATKFPNENFAPSAGNIELAQNRLSTLEDTIKTKISKLQKTKTYFEDRMVKQGRKLTNEDVLDLQDTINILQDSIDTYRANKLPAGEVKQFSDQEVQQAKDGVIKLRRNQMQKIIDDLENEFDEARATGFTNDIPVADKPVLSPEQKIAATNEKIKNIDEAILSLQNELTDKERILNGIIDGYKIADTQIRSEFPEGFSYDKFISDKKNVVGPIGDSAEVSNLRELGIDPEEAVARGTLSKEELTRAAQIMVEHTQGGNNPLMVPGFMRSPYGKVFGQFKSFAYMQANFMLKEVMKNLVSKDTRSVKNAVKFLTITGGLYPMTSGALRDLRDVVTLKKKPEDTFHLQEYWKGLGLISAMGMYTDFIKSAQQGRTLELIAGPAVGDAVKYIESIAGIAAGQKSSLKQFRKQIIDQTGVGRIINNLIDKQ